MNFQGRTNNGACNSVGFIMVETMVALMILIAFALIALQVTAISLRVPAQAAERENGLLTETGAIERLRTDVWSAVKVDIEADGMSVRLQSAGGATMRWSISKEGGISAGDAVDIEEDPGDASFRRSRHNQSVTMTWKAFVSHPSGLELRGQRTSGDRGDHRIILPSPLLMTGKREK